MTAVRSRNKNPGFKLWNKVLIQRDGIPFLQRLTIIETPLFKVMLHKLVGPDPGHDLHDHPWSFASWVYAGSYTERLSEGVLRTLGGKRKLNIKRAEDLHQIIHVEEGTKSFVVCGRRRRRWGFLCDYGSYAQVADCEMCQQQICSKHKPGVPVWIDVDDYKYQL